MMKVIAKVNNKLGECPRWHHQEQALYWVDIDAFRLYRLHVESGDIQYRQFDEEIGCFVFHQNTGFVVAMRSGFYFIDDWQAKLRFIADPQADNSQTRFNDGRCDATGRFLAGTVYPAKDHGGAALFSLDNNLNIKQLQDDVLTANGLAFSPDNQWLYFSDTPRHVIYRYPYNLADGSVGTREVFHQFPYGHGRPDGAAVDSEGYYWSALYEGGRVVRLNPHGEIVQEIQVPAKCPTMVAFGGKDLKTLYITTVGNRPAEELALFPDSGHVFAIELDIAGRTEPSFVHKG